jgi:murein DD-endopeptidase MepM/ murein hydrolase activator NlpD
MTNLYRVGFVTVVAVLSIGAFATIQPGVEDVDPSAAPTLGVLYAAPAERIETHPIQSGETLSGVLEQSRITGTELTTLMLGLREHLNPRRVRAGTEITVRRWNTNEGIRSVEVRLNADTTVRAMRDEVSWQSQVVVTPVDLDTVYTSGEISEGRSLYEAVLLDEASTVPAADRTNLVYTLAEVFEFKLDFTREIQPGDEYRLMYERESRPDGSARSLRILAAELTNDGKPFTAVLFELPGDRTTYYDEKGGSLRRGFTRYPIEFARVTSNFNRKRFHPVLGIYRAHLGTDIGARTGTPVRSTAEGTVTFAGRDGGYGNVVVVRHANGYSTRYAHLSRFASGVRSGKKVALKQTIGYVGATGLATGPHLHYELRKNGRPVDAMREKLPDAPPLEAKYRSRFLSVAEERMALLDQAGLARYASPATEAPRAKLADDGT